VQNEVLRAQLVREIQQYSHQLQAVQLENAMLQQVMVDSYQELIDARETLLDLMPPPNQYHCEH
jgi:hypothetical protein